MTRKSIADLILGDKELLPGDLEYETRLLAFVDLLGWKAATQSMDPTELRRAILPIARRAQIYNEQFREQVRTRKDIIFNPIFMEVQYCFFSDSFVFSTPISFGPRIVTAVGDIALQLLQMGFLTRGAIVKGKVFHLDNIVFGPALVRAVQLEKATVMPRVFFDRESIGDMPMWDMRPVITDSEGTEVVNPFDLPGRGMDMEHFLRESFKFPEIVHSIEVGLRNAAGDDRRLAKWRYAKENVLQALRLFGEEGRPYIEQLRATG